MKNLIYILPVIILGFAGCTKEEKPRTSGVETIDNTTYFGTTYYYLGFSFSSGKQVSTEATPKPDITVFVNTDNVPGRLTLQTTSLRPSFYKVGEYADENAARSAFENLKSVSASQWVDWADPLNANQIWIHRSSTDNYTKIRIVNTVNETRQNIAYGECTFQWVHQPDGSLTFP